MTRARTSYDSYRLLVERVAELASFHRTVSKKEFNEFCDTNSFFRKDLLLELRDITFVVHSLQKYLEELEQ